MKQYITLVHTFYIFECRFWKLDRLITWHTHTNTLKIIHNQA